MLQSRIKLFYTYAMKNTYRLSQAALDEISNPVPLPSPTSVFWQLVALIGIIGIIIAECVWLVR